MLQRVIAGANLGLLDDLNKDELAVSDVQAVEFQHQQESTEEQEGADKITEAWPYPLK